MSESMLHLESLVLPPPELEAHVGLVAHVREEDGRSAPCGRAHGLKHAKIDQGRLGRVAQGPLRAPPGPARLRRGRITHRTVAVPTQSCPRAECRTVCTGCTRSRWANNSWLLRDHRHPGVVHADTRFFTVTHPFSRAPQSRTVSHVHVYAVRVHEGKGHQTQGKAAKSSCVLMCQLTPRSLFKALQLHDARHARCGVVPPVCLGTVETSRQQHIFRLLRQPPPLP